MTVRSEHCQQVIYTKQSNKLVVSLLTNIQYRPIFVSARTASFVPSRMVRGTGITLSTETMWSPTRLSLVMHQHIQWVFTPNKHTHTHTFTVVMYEKCRHYKQHPVYVEEMQKLLSRETILRWAKVLRKFNTDPVSSIIVYKVHKRHLISM